MKVLTLLAIICIPGAVLFVTGCAGNPQRHKTKRHSTNSIAVNPVHEHAVLSSNETGTLVSNGWIETYRRYEAKFGTIAEDSKIYQEGEQYRIPSQVSDHFSEMVKK